MTTKTHRISFEWYRIPYIINEEATISDRIATRSIKMLQDSIFCSLTDTMFTAHKTKRNKEDKKKDSFEIYINGSLEKCEALKKDFDNLHQIDFSKAIRKIPFIHRRKVAEASKEMTKFEKLQENLSRFGIYFEVNINEL